MKITFDNLKVYQDKICHGFSTREGGVSKGPYESMNLRLKSKDERENIFENFKRFSALVGISPSTIVTTDQKHDRHVLVVTAEDVGKGLYKKRDYDNVDGLLTNAKGLTLTTFHADCLPIFLYAPDKGVIGMLHAGWGGTSKGILAEAIKKMKAEFGVDPKNIVMAIGPGLCQNCFEVDQEVRDIFLKMPYDIQRAIDYDQGRHKYYIDLKRINVIIALSMGMEIKNIEVSDHCTKEDPLFFSHRGQGDLRGTMCGMIALK